MDTRRATPGVAKGMLVVSVAVLGAVLALSGCGGGGSTKTVAPVQTGWTQTGATYVGRESCYNCHAKIDQTYSSQAHAKDFATAYPERGNFFDSSVMGGRCASCHTTGEGEPSGWTKDANQAHLRGIGCESCHGPGSKHVATLAKADITRLPSADKTCIRCHLSGTFDGLTTTKPVNDETYKTTLPGKLAVHHPQAQYMMGKLGFGKTTDTVSVHATVPNSCVACHMGASNKDSTSPNAKEDHSSIMTQPDIGKVIGSNPSCKSCHSANRGMMERGVEEWLVKVGGVDEAGHPDHEGDVPGSLLQNFADRHGVNTSTTAVAGDAGTDPSDPWVMKYKAARHNYSLILVDKSMGVHNPSLTYSLIRDTEAILKQ